MSDEDKLVKAGVEAFLKPVSDLIEKIAGPASEEIGLTLRDHIKVFRFKRQLRLFEQVKEMLDSAGILPQRVPLRLLHPIIEAASIEEDDFVQDKWAALLAGAAAGSAGMHPSFVETLKQLSPIEAIFLDMIWEVESEAQSRRGGQESSHKGKPRYRNAHQATVHALTWGTQRIEEDVSKRITIALQSQNLVRLGLAMPETRVEQWSLTAFGREFVKACRGPEKHAAK